jgi:post-segregation antitoxin (ccd killing protein)
MGKERITLDVEIDAELMKRIEASGLTVAAYVERLLRRNTLLHESTEQREARWAAWRTEHKAELDAYNAFIEEHGLWNDGLRLF